jgi:hypothetical protein
MERAEGGQWRDTHGLSVSDDGNHGYFVATGPITPTTLTDPNVAANNADCAGLTCPPCRFL